VVEDGQEGAAADEAVVLEEDLSDEEANSAGPVKWVVPAWEVLAADRGGWRAGLKTEETESEQKLGRRVVGAVRFGKPRTREHNRRAQKRKEGGLWTTYSIYRGQSAGARWQS
jgi:hypothetical protein